MYAVCLTIHWEPIENLLEKINVLFQGNVSFHFELLLRFSLRIFQWYRRGTEDINACHLNMWHNLIVLPLHTKKNTFTWVFWSGAFEQRENLKWKNERMDWMGAIEAFSFRKSPKQTNELSVAKPFPCFVYGDIYMCVHMIWGKRVVVCWFN